MPLDYQVDTRRFDRLAEEYQRRSVVVVQDSVETAGRVGADYARSNHRHKRRSGRLTSRRMLFGVPAQRTRFGAMGGFTNLTYYVRWVEFGNGPPGARIYPRSARFLRFRMNGQIVYRTSVRTSRPFPFMWPAQEVAADAMTQDIGRKLDTVGRAWR